ncbi:4-alpha-glucanotransferase [Rhodospirillaceae bacterium SYSU D60014]|uniref:4-alpha-glucanotransferase n=1 Tax=Virgifigura deserti TaxID=2268457 RepID=UPI000E67025B
MTTETALDRLAQRLGIGDQYRDGHGRPRRISAESKRTLLSAMGFAAESDTAIAAAIQAVDEVPWRRPLEPVLIAAEGEPLPPVPVVLDADRSGHSLSWTVEEEVGRSHRGAVEPGDLPCEASRRIDGRVLERRSMRLPLSLPAGYHRLRLSGAAEASTVLIVAPPRCYWPPALEGEGRMWGVAIQLYGLRSERNWGIGDFTDLRHLAEALAPLGVGVIGVNPLHALFIENPNRISPYSPASRLFLNVLYIDVEAVPDLDACPAARTAIDRMRESGRFEELRAAALVDYPGVSGAKLPVLEELYRSFRTTHLAEGGTAKGDTNRAAAFHAFQAREGQALETFSLFEALSEHFRRTGSGVHSWRDWPVPYHDPASPEVAAFAAEQRERIEFFQYLQWQADLQLQAVGDRCTQLGMQIGLYRDLALGVDSDGAEFWAQQRLFARGTAIGAPPDLFNTKGQDWGLPPMTPRALRENAYRPLIEVLRANMRHTGALRIDHILGLMRLFWVPHGASPTEGGYVNYPLADMLAVLALESQRSRCLVIGEDLGTVPEGLVDRLHGYGILSYRLLYFEQTGDGDFLLPEAYPPLALVGVTTHDLPTLPGYWRGRDIDLRARLDLFPSDDARRDAQRARDRDRRCLLDALRRQGLLPAGESPEDELDRPPSERLVQAAYRYLARTPSKLLMVTLEDVLGEEEQPNLPGTTDEHPNWRRKLPLGIDELAADPRVRALTATIRDLRPAPRAGQAAGQGAS